MLLFPVGEDHDVEHFTAKTGESVDLNDQLLHGTDLLSHKTPDHISPTNWSNILKKRLIRESSSGVNKNSKF
jgi:hypothetical protein